MEAVDILEAVVAVVDRDIVATALDMQDLVRHRGLGNTVLVDAINESVSQK
jgi:hypothetical protein